ncbi:sugar phosphate nucleotidyltransferase [Sphaerimonospora cavernae]|uniref:Sugar phosphate nucleotidyltransferase n=1 Tax=Sphaerimonospora cavernae TaxID=1740611 RepID=A0ABV6U2R4_9ACTN
MGNSGSRSLEAILLVGGKGTRLRPLTMSIPKPLLPTAGVPLLEHQLARAAAAGVRHVVFATAYRAEMFAESFGSGGRFGLEITYVTEDVPLGTGGAIRNASSALRSGPDDPVFILNGDIISGHDMAAQLAAHEKADAAVTLHLTTVEDPRRYGSVLTDAHGRVEAFIEKSPTPVTDQVNAGCYIFRRGVIDEIPAGRPVSVEYELFPKFLAESTPVLGHVDPAYWLDVGTPAAFVQCCCDLALGRVQSPALPVQGVPALVAEGSVVAPDARVEGGSTIGAGVLVASAAVIDASVVMDGAVVAEDARVTRSVVGRGVKIGPGVVVEDAIVGDEAVIEAGNELRGGIRIWPRSVISGTSVRFSSDM